MGSKTSFSHYDKSTVGLILGMDSAVPKFELAKDSKDYIRWDSTEGKFKLWYDDNALLVIPCLFLAILINSGYTILIDLKIINCRLPT